MTAAKKATDAPQDPATPDLNAARPLEGTGVGLGNPWDVAYGSNVPPKRDTTAVPPSEDGHLGAMADPTPRDEYTVAGVIAKAAENKEA